LALATLAVQVAMIARSIWGLPLRNISTMAAAFTRGIMHTPQVNLKPIVKRSGRYH
jgi:hypothetical protein